MSKSIEIVRTVKWTNDATTEMPFKLNKLKPSIEVIPLDDIERWDENPARPTEKLDKEKVAEYSLAMKNGDAFPRPVLLKTKNKLRIIGGHHRIPAAKECGDTHIEAYVVETDDEFVRQSLAMELNIRHGVGYSLKRRLDLAMDKINEFSISVADASRRYNVSESSLANKKIADKIRVTIEKAGIIGLDQSHLIRLNVLEDNENLLLATARLAKDANLTGEQIGELTRGVRKQKNESGGIAEIERRRAELAATAPPSYESRKRQPRTKLMTAITLLLNLVNEKTTMFTYQLTTKEQQKIATEKLDELTTEIRSFLQRTKKTARPGTSDDSK